MISEERRKAGRRVRQTGSSLLSPPAVSCSSVNTPVCCLLRRYQNIVPSQTRHQTLVNMDCQSPIRTLPEEVLMSVMSWLPVSDLCNAILVCRHWRTIGNLSSHISLRHRDVVLGEDPQLWRRYKLEINYGTKRLAQTLSFARFSKLGKCHENIKNHTTRIIKISTECL